ncbi:MAG: CPBP family intramembrane metalloprotease [Planctomycetota bacterium]|nr:CPBP family intramembrane metalloprotease [Planctomycetota bacterium]
MTSHSPNELPDDDDSRADVYAAYEAPEASIFEAEIADGAEDTTQVPARPHPHFGWAVLWMFGLWAVQIAVSVAIAAVVIVIAVVQGQTSAEQMARTLADSEPAMIPILTFSSAIAAIVVAIIFYRRQFGKRLALRGMAGKQWLASLLAVLPLAIIASEITNCASEVLPSFNAELLGQFAASPWPVVFVAACLFPAIGEEIFCRGFLGRGLVAHHGAVRGVLLASLLFGIMHIDPVQSVGAFVLGLGMHFIYLTTRSLLAPMLVHMLNNTFAFWVMRNYEWCPLPGLSPLPDGSQVHTPPSVLITAIAAAAALLGLLYQTRTRWLLANYDLQSGEETAWSPGYVTAEQPPAGVDCRAATSPMKFWLAALVVLSYVALLAALAVESGAVLRP